MVKWIFNNKYLENKDFFFIICGTIILTMIVIAFYLVFKKLKENKNVHK